MIEADPRNATVDDSRRRRDKDLLSADCRANREYLAEARSRSARTALYHEMDQWEPS